MQLGKENMRTSIPMSCRACGRGESRRMVDSHSEIQVVSYGSCSQCPLSECMPDVDDLVGAGLVDVVY